MGSLAESYGCVRGGHCRCFDGSKALLLLLMVAGLVRWSDSSMKWAIFGLYTKLKLFCRLKCVFQFLVQHYTALYPVIEMR